MGDFNEILIASRRIAEEYPGVVFIGGVAVYLHAANTPRAREAAEASHDVDFMLSLADLSDLRHTDELVANRRLGKHQLIRGPVEFDVYVERQNSLAVPYDEAVAHADTYEGIRVAAIEHLLILKLNAYLDRSQSAKGDKDARDLVTISQVAGGKVRRPLVEPYLREEHLQALETVANSPVFTYLSKGNAHRAKLLRTTFSDFAVKIAGGRATGKPTKRKPRS